MASGDESGGIVTIREYLESRLCAMEKAVGLASAQMEKRLEGMNEFREQLKAQAATFLTRESYDAKHEMLQRQVDELRMSKATLEGKASQQSVNVSLIISMVGTLLAIAALVVHIIK